MEAGQVRSVYLTLNYHRAGDRGVVVHEIQFRKDGKSISESTPAKPDRPDRLLLDKTLLPQMPFVRCERIGSELYLFAGESNLPLNAYVNQAYVVDVKSSGGELVKFHDLPYVDCTSPNIIAAHGRLYHLAVPDRNRGGVPMPFEVYDPSPKSWDPLPPIPQCPFVPYADARKMYLGYAVWGTCILFSFGYPGISMTKIVFVPVLFDAESRTWHQVYVPQDVWGLYDCFPWRDKAVVVGDTVYALGFKKGTVISFSITKSGSEEDGSLSYSLTKPYFLRGLNIVHHPKYNRFDRMFHCWCPLGDFEFCLVLTIDHAERKYQYQPFFITTFKIIHKKGTFSCIETIYSAVQCTGTQDYGHFWPIFCYNPDYEPKEILLTTTEDMLKERNMIGAISQEVDTDILDISSKEASLINDEKVVGMQNETNNVKCRSSCNVDCLKLDSELRGENVTTVETKSSLGKIDSNSGDFEPKESVINRKKARKRLKKKVKRSENKGTKRDSYIVSLVKCQVSTSKSYFPIGCLIIILFIGFLFGFFSHLENLK